MAEETDSFVGVYLTIPINYDPRTINYELKNYNHLGGVIESYTL
ncbi:hypothetical protein HDF24_10475 [Mucilaginibacter sp. X4EP1]|nr:hypothetical protein [Mucilaginibacter sp. X4EP1]MCS3816340.1 hypothetical protein [Mucilaginibacter sp. X4EP1]